MQPSATAMQLDLFSYQAVTPAEPTCDERAIGPGQDQITALRAEISELTAALGRTTIPEFGTVEITAAATVASYDRAGLDRLVHALLADGQPELAQQINGLRKETSRAGSLRISRAKPALPTADA